MTRTGQPDWDLRLVPAALGSWLVAILVLLTPSPSSSAVSAVAIAPPGAIAVVVLGALLRSPSRIRWRQGPALGVLVTSAALLVVGVAAWTATAPEATAIVDRAAAARHLVVAEVRVDGDPVRREARVRGPWRGPEFVDSSARLRSVDSPDGSWTMDVPILLRLEVEPAAMPPPGTLLKVTGRLASVDWSPQVTGILTAQRPPEVLAAPAPWQQAVTAVRTGLRASLADVPADAGALVAGLAVGDESLHPEGLDEAMRVSGLAHLTAVSGGNIAIVLGAVVLLGRLVGLPVALRAVTGGLAVLGYVLIVGPEPSVLRAAGMGTVAVLALVVGGRGRGLSALAATVVVLLVLSPPLALSLGFALSVAATAGLLVIAPALRTRMHRLVARGPLRDRPRIAQTLGDAIAVTFAAQLATAPLLASLGQGLSTVAILANVLASPAVAPVTLLGVLAAVTSPVLPPLAVLCAHLAAPPAAWISWWATTLADVPAATLPWPGGIGGALAAIAALIAGTWVVRVGSRRGWPLRTAGLVVLVVAFVIAVRPPDRAGWPPPQWRAVACDVGQGDAMVVSTRPGAALVVDTGPDPDLIDECLTDLGIAEIDALVLTHFHADHVEGVPGVLRGRRIHSVLVSPLREPLSQAQRVDSWLARDGLTARVARAGQVSRFADDVTGRIVWPERIIREGSMPNNASVVLDLQVRGVRMLLLGDLEPAAQVALRARRGPQAYDVVKVPHHGSRYQDPRLASWTGGRIAVISVGRDNDYGHPAEETLTAWQSVAARVARTDRDGDVAVVHRDGQLGVVTRE